MEHFFGYWPVAMAAKSVNPLVNEQDWEIESVQFFVVEQDGKPNIKLGVHLVRGFER